MRVEADPIAVTRAWVDQAVIGLNLCPFAKAVQVKGQVRYVLSLARDEQELLAALTQELSHLASTDPTETDTTLLIHPAVLQDFLDFNDFLALADATVEAMGLAGVIQIASFHPDYQFADAPADDFSHHTNRSPHPTLHLLREASLDAAVAAFPDAADIYERNIDTLQRLGSHGWQQLAAAIEVQAASAAAPTPETGANR